MKNATHLLVEAEVRYWEDATVNGVEDVDGSLIPFKRGDIWKPAIRLADGQIVNWPQGTKADIHYKVCDAGEYFLADDNLQKVAKYNDYYVPNDFLCHGDNGWGDYIIFNVGADGVIRNWRRPEVDEGEWTAI